MSGSAVLAAPPSAAPRFRHVPGYGESAGRDAIELAASAGVNLDLWQQRVLIDGLGERPDGKWTAFEVAVNGPRQNGKNEIALARELAGLFLFNEQLLIHSAHEFKTSTEHQRRIEQVIQDTPDLHKRVKPNGYRHSHGEEGIELRSGQRIRFMTRTKGGGRGHTGDLVVLDEAMILAAMLIGALIPTMSARSIIGNPQLWYFLTAVDQMINENGVHAASIRERGLRGDDEQLAYLEWSAAFRLEDGREAGPADLSVAMATDRALWARANPAMGIRISEDHIAKEQRLMTPRTFAVERLGIGDWPPTDGSASSVIGKDDWDDLGDGKSTAVDPVCFAFDVNPERTWSTIGAAGARPDGLGHLEVIDRRAGTEWVVGRLVELGKHKPVGVVCDGASPAASLVRDLEAQGFTVCSSTAEAAKANGKTVTVLGTKEYGRACGAFLDAVNQKADRHRPCAELDAAVRGAAKRSLGDAWAWSRRSSVVDISPLVAVTLARWGSKEIKPTYRTAGFA